MKRELKLGEMSLAAHLFFWLAPVLLTGITHTVATSETGYPTGWTVFVALMTAGTKSGLVLIYFMLLRFEKSVLKVMMPLLLVGLLIFVSLAFSVVDREHAGRLLVHHEEKISVLWMDL